MKYKMFEEVVLGGDVPGKNLEAGDVATVVDHHPVFEGEDGYSPKSAILKCEIFSVRSLAPDDQIASGIRVVEGANRAFQAGNTAFSPHDLAGEINWLTGQGGLRGVVVPSWGQLI